MSGALLSIILDVVVLVFLGMTIYYAMRLSKNLSNFRVQRNEMKKMIDVLVKNIDQANSAIAGLKAAGKSSGENLQELINESVALTDELQLMNEAGNNLAMRLERLAEGSGSRGAGRESITPRSENIGSPFLIQDRDFEHPYEEEEPASAWGDEDMDTDTDQDIPADLQSRAERELFQALRRNQQKKSSGGGV